VKLPGPRRTLTAVLAGAFLLLLYLVRSILPPFLLALALTYLLDPPVRYLVRRGLSRLAALVILYLVLGLLAAVLFYFLVPGFVAQLSRLADEVPRYGRQLQEWVSRVQRDYTRAPLPDALREAVDQGIRDLQDGLLRGVESVLGGMASLLTGLFSLLLAPVLAFYLLRDLDRLKHGALTLIPPAARAEALGLLREIDASLGGFVRGQLLVAAVTGLLSAVALSLLGVNFSVLLGLFIALTDVIPYVGPILGAVPAVAIALLQSPVLALKVVAALVLVQQFEAAVVHPRIVGTTVGLHPLTVIFAVLAGVRLRGAVGLVLAVPVAAVFGVLWRHVRSRQG